MGGRGSQEGRGSHLDVSGGGNQIEYNDLNQSNMMDTSQAALNRDGDGDDDDIDMGDAPAAINLNPKRSISVAVDDEEDKTSRNMGDM